MTRALVLVSYDIRCPKRWRRVFAHLKPRGVHQQLSVFLLRLDPVGMASLAADLDALIDPAADSVLIARIDAVAGAPLSLGATAPVPGAQVVIF
jgi:CRISPR-associated protein Cas2